MKIIASVESEELDKIIVRVGRLALRVMELEENELTTKERVKALEEEMRWHRPEDTREVSK